MGLERRSSESWVSDDLFVFVGFVGEAHAMAVGFGTVFMYLDGLRVQPTLRVAWLQLEESRRDICLPSFPRRRESILEFRQLFLNICFLGFPMDSRLRGNDGCWR